ncbi:hypothetical protein P153DRAFT_12506 [Dothidotthia symphoricarpi CBS 119687]|uniref:Uncharacterized protein n=1 Tax=Dothidotthia symphoricarpi CBS 119687 TaxID=1392245 RepID=A0A6A6ATK2_9PLEO|nr:uncharacterized protein P153DRAFT_12506 [Dothidotthia symphoricarpi CBS 119687]KAF2134916.1 hypothetical protein P153DRAFT_12506 [Dothidotthia symphoricarpi CBS 119687]
MRRCGAVASKHAPRRTWTSQRMEELRVFFYELLLVLGMAVQQPKWSIAGSEAKQHLGFGEPLRVCARGSHLLAAEEWVGKAVVASVRAGCVCRGEKGWHGPNRPNRAAKHRVRDASNRIYLGNRNSWQHEAECRADVCSRVKCSVAWLGKKTAWGRKMLVFGCSASSLEVSRVHRRSVLS